MKVWIELEGEDELQEFLRWRRLAKAQAEKQREQAAFDAQHGRTEIASLGLPDALLRAVRRAGVQTVEQANAMSDIEWLMTPGFGKKHLQTLRDLLAVNRAP